MDSNNPLTQSPNSLTSATGPTPVSGGVVMPEASTTSTILNPPATGASAPAASMAPSLTTPLAPGAAKVDSASTFGAASITTGTASTPDTTSALSGAPVSSQANNMAPALGATPASNMGPTPGVVPTPSTAISAPSPMAPIPTTTAPTPTLNSPTDASNVAASLSPTQPLILPTEAPANLTTPVAPANVSAPATPTNIAVTPAATLNLSTGTPAVAGGTLGESSNSALPTTPDFSGNATGFANATPFIVPEPPAAKPEVQEDLNAPLQAAAPVPGSIGSAFSGNDPAAVAAAAKKNAKIKIGKTEIDKRTFIIACVLAGVIILVLVVILIMQLTGAL